MAKRCVYCGSKGDLGKDHVIPRALYPPSKQRSEVPRITVPACTVCNNSYSDDEPHFRNVLVIAGEANAPVHELWQGKVARSFEQVDGARRRRDVRGVMKAVMTAQGERHAVFPGKDDRFMRILRKCIRGLCFHNCGLLPVWDNQVLAVLQDFEIPPAFAEEMRAGLTDADIIQYSYAELDDADFHSYWRLCFFERTPFFGIVFRSVAARRRVEAENVASQNTCR